MVVDWLRLGRRCTTGLVGLGILAGQQGCGSVDDAEMGPISTSSSRSALVEQTSLSDICGPMDGLSATGSPMAGTCPSRVGRSPFFGAQTPTRAWALDAGGLGLSPVIGSEGTVYVGATRGRLFAVSRDGEMLWSYSVEGEVSTSAVVGADGMVYFGASDGRLHAVAPDGQASWQFETAGAVVSSPVVGPDGLIYFGARVARGDHRLLAVAPDGTERWRSAKIQSRIKSAPTLGRDGVIYLGANDGRLRAFLPNGVEMWAYDAGSPVRGAAAVDPDGVVYVGSRGGQLHAIGPDGSARWQYAVGAAIRTDPAIAADGTVYIGADDGALHAVQPCGVSKWTFMTGGPVRGSATIGADGTVYFGSDDEHAYALRQDGTELWRHRASGPVRARPAIAPSGRLYVGGLGLAMRALGEVGLEVAPLSLPTQIAEDAVDYPLTASVTVGALPDDACGDACSFDLAYEFRVTEVSTGLTKRVIEGVIYDVSAGAVDISESWDLRDGEGVAIEGGAFTVGVAITVRGGGGPYGAETVTYTSDSIVMKRCNLASCRAKVMKTSHVCHLLGDGVPGGDRGRQDDWPHNYPPHSDPPYSDIVYGLDLGVPFVRTSQKNGETVQEHVFTFGDVLALWPERYKSPYILNGEEVLVADNDDALATAPDGQHDQIWNKGACLDVTLPMDDSASFIPTTVDGSYVDGGKWLGGLSVPGPGFSIAGKVFAIAPDYGGTVDPENIHFYACTEDDDCLGLAPDGVESACLEIPCDPEDTSEACEARQCYMGCGSNSDSADPACQPIFKARPVIAVSRGSVDDSAGMEEFSTDTSEHIADPDAFMATYTEDLKFGGPTYFTDEPNRRLYALGAGGHLLYHEYRDGKLQAPLYYQGQEGNFSSDPAAATPALITEWMQWPQISYSEQSDEWILMFARQVPALDWSCIDGDLGALCRSFKVLYGSIIGDAFRKEHDKFANAGVQIRTAPNPWGPWSETVTMYNPKAHDAGFCELLWFDEDKSILGEDGLPFTCNTSNKRGKRNATLNNNSWIRGAVYGAAVLGGFSKYRTFDVMPAFGNRKEAERELYWIMSTFNPYRVAMMKTVISDYAVYDESLTFGPIRYKLYPIRPVDIWPCTSCPWIEQPWLRDMAYSVGDTVVFEGVEYQVMQAHTSQPGLEPTQAYSLWSPVAPAIAAWAPWIVYASGDVVSYNGVDYEVRLPHMSLPGWVPPVVASLWSAVPPPDGSAWAPQTPYGVGDTAVYDGIMYVVLQAHTSQLDWTPPVVAALWSAMQ